MEIDYAKTYQGFIDDEMEQASATEWMTANEGQVRWSGGKDVDVAALTTTGLGNYDSTKTDGTAYPAGAVTSSWESKTLSMDRGVKFALDRTSPEDIGFAANAESVIREFTRSQLAKEQDTYRIQKLYAAAAADETYGATHVVEFTEGTDDLVEKICKLAETLENDSERTGGFVALVAANHKSDFMKASADKYYNIRFEQKMEINGIVYEHVMMLNDLPCLFVPASRMKTALDVQSGREGETAGGILADTDALQIYALIAACDAPLAVAKIDSLKQFGPEENQLFDGTAIQARYLYDLYVADNKVVTLGALVEKSTETDGD